MLGRRSNRTYSTCGVEQLEARLAHNQEVAGSSPVPATVAVAEMAYAPDCGSGLCGFKSRRSPLQVFCNIHSFFLLYVQEKDVYSNPIQMVE